MAFSKVKVGGLADDSVTAANIDDDGTGYTVGNLTNSGTLQQTGQVTLGSGGTNWTLPTARGTDKYVLQINGTTGASTWAESLTAPEISGHNFDVSGSTDDGGINAYEAPYEYTGTTNATTTISSLSSTTGLLAGQYISGAGIPANTTIVSVNTGASTMVISNAVTVSGTQTSVALKIQKTPGEKNGGKVTLTGANFGATIAEITVAITNSAGAVIANASYLSGLSGGNTVTAEWTGTEGSYSTDLTSSYTDPIYFKMTKAGLSSNIHNTNTTLTSDPAVTALSGSSQTGGDISTDPTSSSLGVYGSGRVAGGGQDSNTKLLLNFDRTGGTDIEDSSNRDGVGYKITPSGNAVIKASPFGDGKSAMFFDGSNDRITAANHADFSVGSNAWSLDYWVCVDTSNYGGLVSITNINNSNLPTESNSAFVLYQDSSNPDQLQWYMDDDSTADWDIHTQATGFTFDDNLRWHHIALTYGGSSDQNYRLFVDGILIKTVSTSATMQSSSGNQGIVFGTNQNGGAYFRGYIDEIRWVNGENPFPTTRFTPSKYRYGTAGATHEVSTASNMKLLIHSDQSGAISDYDDNINTQGSIDVNTNFHVGGGDYNNLFNGVYTSNASNGVYWTVSNQQAINNAYFIVSFGGVEQVINKFDSIYHTGTSGSYTIASEVTFSGSNSYSDPASDTGWTSLTPDSGIATTVSGVSNTFDWTIADSASSDRSHLFTNTTAYKYYRIKIHGTPTIHFNPWWSGLVFYNTNNTNDKVTVFQDSSSSNHSITRSGSFHSRGYGGIAPAMTWPASGKATGSAGVYFDGVDGQNLTVNSWGGFGSGDFTFELWAYNTDRDGDTHNSMIFDGGNSSNGGGFTIQIDRTNGRVLIYDRVAGATLIGASSSTYLNEYQWTHIACVRSSGTFKLYFDGTEVGSASNSSNFNSNLMTLGRYRGGNDYNFHGYLDGVRASVGIARYTSNFTPPTRAYGAFGQETPDVGTITLTATGDGDFTWSELAAGTALPGTLAVGSTTHSGSGNSRTHTATITGTLPANTSTTYTNGVKGDIATNNILLKVQHDTDATKAVTLNGTTGMGITQKSTEKPVLFNARRYAGNNTAGREITGFGFGSPDLVWIKCRSDAHHHALFDSVRGVNATDGNKLITNANVAQNDGNYGYGNIKAFTSEGFTLERGSQNGNQHTNMNGETYITWAWKAGGAPTTVDSSSLSGLTSITQSVNTEGKFSITKYTCNATGFKQVPHGLGVVPDFIIVKRISSSQDWICWHKDLDSGNTGASNYIVLNRGNPKGWINGSADGSAYYRSENGGITSTKVEFANQAPTDLNGETYIMYAWKAVSGVSAFGTYEGDGGSVRTITTGFRPRFVMVKNIDSDSTYWAIVNAFTQSGDTITKQIYADLTNAEDTGNHKTMTFSNTGFGFTSASTYAAINENAKTFIYMAFA